MNQEDLDTNLTDAFANARARRAAELKEEDVEYRRKDKKMAYISIGANIFAACITCLVAYPNFWWMMGIAGVYVVSTYFGPMSYLRYLKTKETDV